MHYKIKGWIPSKPNLALGFKADERNFNVCADMFELLGVKQVRLYDKQPTKSRNYEKSGH